MPRHTGPAGLSQLRQQSARDAREEEGVSLGFAWKVSTLCIDTLSACAASLIVNPIHCARVDKTLRLLAPAQAQICLSHKSSLGGKLIPTNI